MGLDKGRIKLLDEKPWLATEGDVLELIEIIKGFQESNDEISQTLGKALGYPWYKDDLKNFPDATEKDGVCVGEHIAETLAIEAVTRIEKMKTQINRWRESRDHFVKAAMSTKDALTKCAECFRNYEAHHLAKTDFVKAERNAEMAKLCENVLKQF